MVPYLTLIGEAARGLSPDFREKHREPDWPKIVAMRNILIHQYFGIDKDLVWTTIEGDLPRLKRQIATLVDQL